LAQAGSIVCPGLSGQPVALSGFQQGARDSRLVDIAAEDHGALGWLIAHYRFDRP
jgi:hypothetical protein